MELTVEHALKKLASELKEELLSDIIPYWLDNTFDQNNGGIIGRINSENKAIEDADKGSILTARVLWTFSAVYRDFKQQAYKKMADHIYTNLSHALWDEEYGGVYWMVSAKGKPVDSRKHVYAQAFTIYALTEYYRSFKNEQALDKAKELYKLIEQNCRDREYGGYFEAYTYNWQLMDDVRLSEKDRNEPKSMNTHLHLLEAYTNLYRCWKNPQLKERLKHLLDVFADHIVNKDGSSQHTFLGKDWTPKSEEISFGHDIETSWLLLEATEVLEDYPRYDTIKEVSLSLAKAVLEKGTDQDGGLFNEAGPAGITDADKDWWPQAEAIVGFLNAYQLSGDIRFLQAAYHVWEFITAYILDKTYGEWHEKVNRAGIPYRLDKVQPWKCPYHNSRAVLETLHRTQALLTSSTKAELADSSFISESSAEENHNP